MSFEVIADFENELEKIDKPHMVKLVQSLYNSDPENFLLIKLGANDGWMCDNLYDFVINNDPHSIMVEPIPCYFDALKNNFSSLNNINYEQVAIDIQNGTRDMYYIHDDEFKKGNISFRLEHMPELSSEHWARGLGSFYEDKNNLGCPELSKHISKINVKTVTICELLEKHNISDKNNLVIVTDCEGHDYEILKSFNFTKYNPVIYISEIELFTRYPENHPRRTKYVNDIVNPGLQKAPTARDVQIEMNEAHHRHAMRLSLEERTKYVNNLVELGLAKITNEIVLTNKSATNEEYYQLNGLYTPAEFKHSINIFQSKGYTLLRQDGQDLVAVQNKFLDKLRSCNVI
tara:strand:+ start:404 stop:1441 length:1038 start_codon:yes stop_codon:yes gene_type:complete